MLNWLCIIDNPMKSHGIRFHDKVTTHRALHLRTGGMQQRHTDRKEIKTARGFYKNCVDEDDVKKFVRRY
jgi:hypothetical protein